MNNNNNNFYNNLIATMSMTEKTASAQVDAGEIKSAIEGLSEDSIESLAYELGILEKEAEATSVEEAVAAQTLTEQLPAAGQKLVADKAINVNEDGREDAHEGAKEQAQHAATVREDVKEDAKKDAVGAPKPADANKSDQDYVQPGSATRAPEVATETVPPEKTAAEADDKKEDDKADKKEDKKPEDKEDDTRKEKSDDKSEGKTEDEQKEENGKTKSDNAIEQTAGEIIDEMTKVASEDVEKIAWEMAEEICKAAGVDLPVFVGSMIQDEKLAGLVVRETEKTASEMEKCAFQVASEITAALANKLEA